MTTSSSPGKGPDCCAMQARISVARLTACLGVLNGLNAHQTGGVNKEYLT